jgi:hypothetical protein
MTILGMRSLDKSAEVPAAPAYYGFGADGLALWLLI